MRPGGRWSVALIAFVLPFAGVTCAADEPSGGGSRENGAIVFTAGNVLQGTPVELFSIGADGGDLRQLTDDGTWKTALSWSPDGSRLAYAAFDNELTAEQSLPEPTSIYVMDADGGGRRVLCELCSRTAYGFEYEPSDVGFNPYVSSVPNSLAWSPDGATIAAPATGPGVILIDADTGASSNIETPEPITAISWSPDGRSLAMSHTWFLAANMVPREGTELGDRYRDLRPGGIYLLDVASGDIDEVISTTGMAHVNGWSPDGDLIAYSHFAFEDEGSQLSAYSISGDRSWPIVPEKHWQWELGGSWSVDGRIADLTEQGAEDNRTALDLLIASSDGRDLRGLPLCRFEGAFDGDNCIRGTIVWSPDGSTVAYRAFIHGTPIVSAVIFQAVDESSTEVVRLDGPTFYTALVDSDSCCLAWLPAAA